MITLEELVTVVHRCALSASDALRRKNLEIIDIYFERAPTSAEVDALSKANAALEEMATANSLKSVQAKIAEVKAALEAAAHRADDTKTDTLRPKMVGIEYPKETIDGPASHVVYVPLISLAPMSMGELTELRFSTELELNVVEDKLQIGFPAPPASTPDDGEGDGDSEEIRARATLEIVIKGSKPPEGWTKVIEGYDRALRAQIPG